MLKREKLKMALQGSLLSLALVCRASGQGRIAFNNYAASLSAVTISSSPGTFNPLDGPAGAYAGSDYTVSLYYVLGTVTNQTVFDSNNPTWVTAVDARFFGTTGIGPGHGWDGDGSGFFDGGIAFFNFALTTAPFQVRAWYNGVGLYTSYEQAASAGHNVGQSNLLPLFVDAPPGPATHESPVRCRRCHKSRRPFFGRSCKCMVRPREYA